MDADYSEDKYSFCCTCNGILILGNTGQTITVEGCYDTNHPSVISYKITDKTILRDALAQTNDFLNDDTLSQLFQRDPDTFSYYYTTLCGNKQACKKFQEIVEGQKEIIDPSVSIPATNYNNLKLLELCSLLASDEEDAEYATNAVKKLGEFQSDVPEDEDPCLMNIRQIQLLQPYMGQFLKKSHRKRYIIFI